MFDPVVSEVTATPGQAVPVAAQVVSGRIHMLAIITEAAQIIPSQLDTACTVCTTVRVSV